MADLRTALSEALETAEIPAVSEVVQESTPEAGNDVPRDEVGRFAPRAQAADTAPVEAPVEPPQAIPRPSTWKKEYWPLYDKLAQGQTLLPEEARKIAEYTNQRENEFKSGVSTYKAEADKAREIQEAIAPFLPKLQQYNINPSQWIQNLGRAHETLALGSPQEKLISFTQLAKEYGVPLHLLAEGAQSPQVDPQVAWLSQKLQQIEGQVTGFQTLQQQREQQEIQNTIWAFEQAPGHEHFGVVKEQMAGLLRAGLADNLENAYQQAIWMNPETRQALQTHAAPVVAEKVQAAAKAKAAAVSPKSASPSASGQVPPKGLRAQLEEQINSALGGGRV